jgi:two-component system sensor histidine kinase KdpD
MLAVALIIGQMTAGLRYQARIASYREERARALYEFARDLSSLLQTEQSSIPRAGHRPDVSRRGRRAGPDDHERVAVRNEGGATLDVDVGAAQWAYDKSQPAGMGTDTLAGSAFLYLPLRAPMRTRGVSRSSRRIAGCCWCPNKRGSSTPSPRSPRSRSSASTTSRSPSRR